MKNNMLIRNLYGEDMPELTGIIALNKAIESYSRICDKVAAMGKNNVAYSKYLQQQVIDKRKGDEIRTEIK